MCGCMGLSTESVKRVFPKVREWPAELFLLSVCFSQAAKHFTRHSRNLGKHFGRTLYILGLHVVGLGFEIYMLLHSDVRATAATQRRGVDILHLVE